MSTPWGQLRQKTRTFKHAALRDLMGVFSPWLGLAESFATPERERLYPASRTFWLFLSQVLSADGSCREAVRTFLAWWALEGRPAASPKTGAYCKARKRLPLDAIRSVHEKMAKNLTGQEDDGALWQGRKVKVIDGSSVSMPDTTANQERYPQPRTQKPECGFPVMRIVALFSLGTGVLLDLAQGSLRVAERTLFHQLWNGFERGDVVLADRGFCSYADFYFLKLRGVDCVMRNHQRRKVGVQEVKRLGKGDRLLLWLKGKPCPTWLTKEKWAAMPITLTVRELVITVDIPGFRSKTLTVATTLLDKKQYPKQALAELYRRRWMAELFLRDIKITLGMDVLRCKTPDMVEKELWMHLIAYNLIRALMVEAVKKHGKPPERLSFKGTVVTVRKWTPIMAAKTLADEERRYMMALLLRYIAHDEVPLRPNRTEPRARKRRPKNYQLLNKPRKRFKEIPHRNRHKKPK